MSQGSSDPAKEFLRAVKRGEGDRVRALLAADPSLIRVADEEGSTGLHHAAWKGHPEVATLLLDAGADVNAQNRNAHWGGTPLHAAAHGNQRVAVELLIARGAEVNATSCNGRTPLQETEIHKATAAARVLKEHGATG